MIVQTWALRARFAAALSQMYGTEVPAYTTLVEVSTAVNRDCVDDGRFGSLDRVTAERHGAIRVGSANELADVADLFAAFGMYPVGFYDLREAVSPVPVISTAFRPIDAEELDRNPFRVFTSMLATDDARFFSPDLKLRVERFIEQRQLFDPALVAQARRIAIDGCPVADADEFVRRCAAAFALSRTPIDKAWYDELSNVSAVAADIAGVSTTHINHLTPRVLDIDELYERMSARGITMIDAIQGPPRTAGPPVLLRQTSFRALAEPRTFRSPDGVISDGSLRVRFGEVEARGVALTRRGRRRYDQAMADPEHWNRYFPTTDAEMAERLRGLDAGRVRISLENPDLVAVSITELPYASAGIREVFVRNQSDRDALWMDLLRKTIPETGAAEARLLVAAAVSFIEDVARTWHLTRRTGVADEMTAIAMSILTSQAAED